MPEQLTGDAPAGVLGLAAWCTLAFLLGALAAVALVRWRARRTT